ncbi:MAG: arginase family protein [Nanoarchaeota archaeon]|nr:arginase family protein [Nanoarchaeota archaeon]
MNKEIVIVYAGLATEKITKFGNKTFMEFQNGPNIFKKYYEQNDIPTINLNEIFKEEGGVLTKDNTQKYTDFYKKLFKQNKIPITIGGDHGITVSATLAANEIYDSDTVRFDRHIDAISYMENNLLPYHHKNPDEENFTIILNTLPESSFVHIGGPFDENSETSYMFEPELEDHIASSIRKIKRSRDVEFLTEKNMNEHNALLNKFADKSNKDIYISIDVDILKEVKPKGCKHVPNSGLIDSKKIKEYVESLSRKKNIVGLDICEISDAPNHEISGKCGGEIMRNTLPLLNISN